MDHTSTLDTGGSGAELTYNMTVPENITNFTVLINSTTMAQIAASSNSKKELIMSLYFWIFGVVLLCLAVVGILTNMLNVYALSKTVRTNRRPMYHCLICMAVVDMLVSRKKNYLALYDLYSYLRDIYLYLYDI